MATNQPNYTVDYNDPRFTAVAKEQATQNENINKTYTQMINDSNKSYDDMINQQDTFMKEQQAAQQQRANLEEEKINVAKEQAQKDYEKEQRGTYINYQNQINPYGADAEQMRQLGLQNSGYSETSQASMYNAYQNRIAVAKESFNRAITDYNLAIKDIQVQNDSKLLEIAQTSLQKKLELLLQKTTAGNQLLQAQWDRQYQYDTFYEGKRQNVLSQINTENSLAEQVRQYNEKMAYQKERDKVADAQWEKQYALQKQQAASKKSSSSKTDIESLLNESKNPSASQYTDTGFGTFSIAGVKHTLAQDSKGNYYVYNTNTQKYSKVNATLSKNKNIITLEDGTVLTK